MRHLWEFLKLSHKWEDIERRTSIFLNLRCRSEYRVWRNGSSSDRFEAFANRDRVLQAGRMREQQRQGIFTRRKRKQNPSWAVVWRASVLELFINLRESKVLFCIVQCTSGRERVTCLLIALAFIMCWICISDCLMALDRSEQPQATASIRSHGNRQLSWRWRCLEGARLPFTSVCQSDPNRNWLVKWRCVRHLLSSSSAAFRDGDR